MLYYEKKVVITSDALVVKLFTLVPETVADVLRFSFQSVPSTEIILYMVANDQLPLLRSLEWEFQWVVMMTGTKIYLLIRIPLNPTVRPLSASGDDISFSNYYSDRLYSVRCSNSSNSSILFQAIIQNDFQTTRSTNIVCYLDTNFAITILLDLFWWPTQATNRT